MFNSVRINLKSGFRRFSTAIRSSHIDDEGDWAFASEWWGGGGGGGASAGETVFRGISRSGNGVVSVLAHPCSKPDKLHWGSAENWLQQRYTEIYPGLKNHGKFVTTGYQWRTLHFNDYTRESTVKVMAAYRQGEPGSMCLMQQAHCLAVPYGGEETIMVLACDFAVLTRQSVSLDVFCKSLSLDQYGYHPKLKVSMDPEDVKSLIAAGLATISSCNYDFKKAVLGRQNMNILCIGHGGGSIPLFLASKIRGAIVHIVEIDPIVISASIQAMGFPSFSVITPSGKRAFAKPDHADEILWKGTHERLFLFNSDAEQFILESNNIYDIIFIDAYDGDDIFPHKLWNPHSPFLQALGNCLHQDHGTVVVNLHSYVDLNVDASHPSGLPFVPKDQYVSQVSRSYKDALLGNGNSARGFAYTVSVPWLYNTSLVVCRGFGRPEDSSGQNLVFSTLMSKALEVDKLINMPFSCLQYIKRSFTPVD